MNTKVGQTISADQFKKAYPVGTTISGKDFSSKYGITPQAEQPKTIQGFGQNLISGGQNLMGGINNLLQATQTPLGISDYTKGSKDSFDFLKGIPLGIADTVVGLASNPVDYTYKNPVNVIALLLGAKGLKDSGAVTKASNAAKVIRHPIATTGEKLATTVKNTPGTIENSLLEKYFGTSTNPNPDLIKGVGTASDKGILSRILGHEISTQGKSPGGETIKGPTAEDIFGFRKGAGAKGYDSSLSPVHQQLWRNIQRAYSNVLHEANPETAPIDKALHTLKTVQKVTAHLPRATKYIITYEILRKLLGVATNSIGL
jgi:hypothetical protein